MSKLLFLSMCKPLGIAETSIFNYLPLNKNFKYDHELKCTKSYIYQKTFFKEFNCAYQKQGLNIFNFSMCS